MSASTDQTSPSGVQFPVVISAADRGTQIVVIDASFGKVASGVGWLQVPLTPGVYKARFKAGDRIEDQLFEVIDRPVNIRGERLSFSSPIPLPGLSNTHEYHEGPSRTIAQGPPTVTLGHGAALVWFVRDSKHSYGKLVSAPPPWAGMCLRGSHQQMLSPLELSATVDFAGASAGSKIALNPGVYFLAQPDVAHASTLFELPIAVCDGWCTHVYIDSCDDLATTPGGGSTRRADISGAAVVMVPLSYGGSFDPEVARLTELARQGLLSGHQAVSEQDLGDMVTGKFEYPMLGLYAMHLLRGRAPVDWSLIATIAGNLDRLLNSSHPDVRVFIDVCRARGVAVNAPEHAVPRPWPPVLGATWDLANDNAQGLPLQRVLDSLDDMWLRQYRLSGRSIWSCLLVPQANVPFSPQWAAAAKEIELSESTGTFESPAALIEPEAPPSAESAELEEPPAPARSPVLASPASGAGPSAEVAQPSLADWKGLIDGLRQPNPDHTPFQQALRRRVLDLTTADPDLHEDPERRFKFNTLASEFRMAPSLALAAYHALRDDAAAATQAVLAKTPK